MLTEIPLSEFTSANSEKEFNSSDYLKSFLNIKISEEQIRKTLQAFSYFATSNKDYKYNLTYITDQIDLFLKKLRLIKMKKKVYESVVNEQSLLKNKRQECMGIVFDNCFIYRSTQPRSIEFVDEPIFFSKEDTSSVIVHLYFIVKDENKEKKFSYSLSYKDACTFNEKGKNDILDKIGKAIK